ncbi:MAG TPA: YigZ family protein [Candidatus Dorea intestinavium]|nr:YigZ family protein [Candidatus Dorea intestinavium]
MENYKIIYQSGSGEIQEKKSRFIGTTFAIKSEEEAKEIIEVTKKKYWDARHNCYAYIVGKNPGIKRFSDDGEPQGTAGKPILDVLEGAGIVNALLIVTRYFGGTLLGTGGLIRAYTGAAKEGLNNSLLIVQKEGVHIIISSNYPDFGKIRYEIEQREIPFFNIDYQELVTIELLCTKEESKEIIKMVEEITSGRGEVKNEEEIVFGETDKKRILLE